MQGLGRGTGAGRWVRGTQSGGRASGWQRGARLFGSPQCRHHPQPVAVPREWLNTQPLLANAGQPCGQLPSLYPVSQAPVLAPAPKERTREQPRRSSAVCFRALVLATTVWLVSCCAAWLGGEGTETGSRRGRTGMQKGGGDTEGRAAEWAGPWREGRPQETRSRAEERERTGGRTHRHERGGARGGAVT